MKTLTAVVVAISFLVLAFAFPQPAPAAASPAISAPPDQLVGEGDGYVDLAVRLSAPSASPVTVKYRTVQDSAGAYDFAYVEGTLTFAPGETTKVVRVDIEEDGFEEGLESFSLELKEAQNATISRASSRIGIVDNDKVVATPKLFVRDATVDEKDGTALVSVLLGGPAGEASGSTVTVDYATANGTATAGADYTAVSGTLTFAPGETAKTIAVPIADDATAEPAENFTLNLTSPSNATISDATGVVTIGASDAPAAASPAISAPPDQLVGEGDGYVDLAVRLSAPSASPVTVKYRTVQDSAGAYDFAYVEGTLTFAPGETTKVVRVDIEEDGFEEGLESFSLELKEAQNATISRASSRIGIVDNDKVVATPKLFVRDATVDEKDGTALVSVLLGGPAGEASGSTVTVDYATANGTATAGADYTAVSGTLTFAPGETAKTIAVPIADDATAEPAENFTLNLTSPSNATISDATGVVTIGASDAPAAASPAISAPPDQLVGEGDGYVDLAVRLSAPSASPVTVKYRTVQDSAGAYDFAYVEGTLTFAPGETTKVVRVDIEEDGFEEGLESFSLELKEAQNATISRASSRIGIVDNDKVVATPKLFVRDATVDEKDGTALVSVLLGGPAGEASGSTVTVDYATANGTATAGADYTAVSGTLTFAPGETAKTIAVPIADDATAEPAENFTLNLTSPSNATISDATGVVTIGASDAPAAASPAISAPPDQLVGEGDGYVDLAVRLSAPSASPVTVKYRTVQDSAGAYDFAYVEGTLTFAPGETTKVVRVDIEEDGFEEGLESFSLELKEAQNATISRASSRIGIVDNDKVVATPKLFVRDATVDEKDGTALVSVLLGGPAGEASGSTVTVDYATANGTATAGADYTAVSGTLTFAPGETAKTIAVPIADDATAEPAENFTLNLTSPSNATISDATGVVTIGASDAPAAASPAISAPPDQLVGEGDGYVDLAVRLSAPSASPVTVKYRTVQDSAGAYDFAYVEGTLTFAPGETTKVVRVDIEEDGFEEGLESFSLELKEAQNATISRASAKVTIVDSGMTLDSIAVTPATPSLMAGSNQQLTATGNFSDSETLDMTSAVTWSSSNEAVATIDAGGLAHGVAEGTSTITATLGSASGEALLTVTESPKSNQTISFAPLANKTLGDPDFAVGATASSGLPVSFAASGSCTVSGATVHLTGPGGCTITASQPGDSTHNPAPDVERSFSIASAKSNQTISFAPLANKTLGDPDFAVGATASSGLPVSFAASGSCTVSGATVHLTGPGGCTITASQPGDSTHNPAPDVERSFSIASAKSNQTISFAPLANKTLGDPDFAVGATASSGLPVSFAASGSCTVSGATVHLTGPGGCTITASQPGDSTHNPAPDVERSFSIARRQACIVPNVVDLPLKAAKSRIERRHCHIGKVRRIFSRKRRKRQKGIVVAQSRAPGRSVPANSKINLVVRRGSRR